MKPTTEENQQSQKWILWDINENDKTIRQANQQKKRGHKKPMSEMKKESSLLISRH